MDNRKGEFYEENWFVILMLILLFPLGLVLMWHYESFTKDTRIAVTAVLGAVFYIC